MMSNSYEIIQPTRKTEVFEIFCLRQILDYELNC